jgi:thymidylate synthase (FAD)
MKAEYIDHLGSDLTVVNSARVSFDKESNWENISQDDGDDPVNVLSQADTKLIRYLARHNHLSPFTHPQITLRETVPIFVARQRFKHVVGFTYNEVSRRYVDTPPEFYVPDEWRSRPEGSVKQGSAGIHKDSDQIAGLYTHTVQITLDTYTQMIERGIAPEQARMVLPQSMMTSYYVTGSLSAFARAYKLRSDNHAQLEIQLLAKEWDKIIKPLFPISWEALVGEY